MIFISNSKIFQRKANTVSVFNTRYAQEFSTSSTLCRFPLSELVTAHRIGPGPRIMSLGVVKNQVAKGYKINMPKPTTH